MAGIIARTARARLQGEELLTMGAALIAQILLGMQRHGIWVWRNTAMTDLIVEDGTVVGVLAERQGRAVTIRARHGVLLAAGGFAHNGDLRRENQAHPISGQWSAANPGDTGDALRAGAGLGAATANLDEAIWVIAGMLNGAPVFTNWERSLPHSIMVDGTAQRYMNESAPYMEAGQRMLERNRTVPAVPSWLIFDSQHRRHYPFGTMAPGVTPRNWIATGFMKKARTLDQLAHQCGLDADALRRTVDRFNQLAATGRDEDFGCGATSYDRYFGDASNKPNPNLGPISKPPFYAVAQYVSDVGTVGGLVTDEYARVLREDGSPIDGLYASGCASASVHGKIYPAPGASISNSLTFGYVAAGRVASRAMAASRAGEPEVVV
jgi:3-oxosteroid 1-dehydrogenase